MAKILLLNPSMEYIYKNTKVKGSVAAYFPLNLLLVAAPLIKKGHEVRFIDFFIQPFNKTKLINLLDSFKPDYVGTTFTTPLYDEALKIISVVKEHNPHIISVAGGTHMSSMPRETLKNSDIDIGVMGEGDYTFLDIVENPSLSKVKGIIYKKEGIIIINERRPLMENIDDVPFPALDLININDYNIPHTIARENPVYPMETSRGCMYGCVYCNKSVFGRSFRKKSVRKIIKELIRIKSLGFKEVHIMDDGFTTDMEHAEKVCNAIIKSKINITINCLSGIRADRVNLSLLRLMKKAGIYRASIGVETGSQKILDNIDKKTSLKKIERAFKLAKKAKIETLGYFMFGLPNETEEDMKKTIQFAKKLRPDVVKFDIMMPLPSTPIFNEWKKAGLLTTYDWKLYNFHSPVKVYTHPNLEWKTIYKYLHKAYRSFYLSPYFIARRLLFSIKRGTLVDDMKLFLNTKW